MEFDASTLPENPQLKEYFSWRATCVTEAQQKNLLNHLGEEICIKGKFIACVKMSNPPEKIEGNRAYFPKGTQMICCTLTDSDGSQYFPVFTSEEEVKKWEALKSAGATMVVLTFDDFQPLMNMHRTFKGVVIDPMSDNFFMSRQLIGAWTLNKARVAEAARRRREEDEEAEDTDA